MDGIRSALPSKLDLVVGLMLTGFAIAAPRLAFVFAAPGVVVVSGIDMLARACGADLGLLHDWTPGPVAIVLGLTVNVIVWTLATRAIRWLCRMR